jgi:hypothetical protein
MLDPRRFPDRDAIEAHLLDRYVPSVYDDGRSPAAPAQVRAWLEFLAVHLYRLTTRAFEWWQLYRSVPARAAQWTFVLTVGLTGLVVAMIVFTVLVGPAAAPVAGVAVGVACGVTAAVARRFGSVPGQPVRFAVRLGRGGDLGDMIRSTVVGGLAPGLVFAVVTSFAVNPLFGVIGGIVAGLLAGLLVGLVRWSVPVERANAVSPRSVLASDRRASLIQGLAAVVLATGTIGAVLALRFDPVPAAVTAAVGGSFLGLGFTLGTAWAWFQAARLWLALRGRLPWRLMRFLDDAHRRGVLRQTGAVYEFRHGRLQDHLAANR